MKITGTDGKEYTIEPEANLRDANLILERDRLEEC